MTQDFRDEEPAWTKYLVYRDSRSDKFYEARIDMGDDGRFYLTKRWGRRPDGGVGQIKVETYDSLTVAIRFANEIIHAKVSKGYWEADRPSTASAQVAKEYDDY